MSAQHHNNSTDSETENLQAQQDEKMKFRELNLEGTVYKTMFSKKYDKKEQWKKPDPGQIVSFIPGTITQVFVKPGDQLNAGDDMVVFQAMKMQNHVKAPKASVVKKVHVAEGDKIPKGFVMIELK